MINNIVNRIFYKARALSVRARRILSLNKTLVDPIIVFQSGKVGSLTVQRSLEEAYKQLKVPVEIYHAHALNQLNERENFIKRTRKDPSESLFYINEWRKLRRDIDTHPKKKWNIINLVRDPVALKVSALFQLLDQHVPDWRKRAIDGTLTLNELAELFFSKGEFGFAGLDRWYDDQIKAIWDLDVYATPFPTQTGYQIYHTSNIRLIIIRLEDLNTVAKQAFDDFLGLKDFEVFNTNVGEEKVYANLYKEFKSRPLPLEYIKRAYQSRYANHFYTQTEIESFTKKWTASA